MSKNSVPASDYQIAPTPDNEGQRLTALRGALCAYVPKELRFDRITRMAQRMLHVPIVLISIIEDDVQWFRSAQGLNVPETSRDISFCGHAIMAAGVFEVSDTLLDPRFKYNPLVTGPPHIRSYFGWPLEIAPGLRVGTLCAIDTMPRRFGPEDMEIMDDLARMAEAELRVDAMAKQQKALLLESSRAQRQQLLDPLTGTWSERGFEELLRRTLVDVAGSEAHAALCAIQILNLEDFGSGEDEGHRQTRAMLISEFIRHRLPNNALLCHLPGGRACILFAARDSSLLAEQINHFLQTPDHASVAGVSFSQRLHIRHCILRLVPNYAPNQAGQLLEQVMGKLTESEDGISTLT